MSQNLNDHAQAKFAELKKRMKLDLQQPVKEKRPDLTQEKLDQMMDSRHVLTKEETKELVKDSELNSAMSKAEEVDELFAYIDSLKLPTQLSLVIGLIISGHKTNNKKDIALAVAALGEYINGN